MKRTPPDTRRRGFTLAEILVVIGIIVLLVAIGLPMLSRAFRQAKATRIAADLQTIGVALDAYKADFGDYPRVRQVSLAASVADRPNPATGAQILCQALMGPAPATEVPAPAPGIERFKQDGHAGPGFKTGRRDPGVDLALNTADDIVQGRTWGPYLPADKFKMIDPASPTVTPPNPLLLVLLDNDEHPILYYPARAARPNITVISGAAPDDVGGYVRRSESSLYDADDNFEAFRRGTEADAVVLARIQAALGDYDGSGTIDAAAGEKAVSEAPYLLWTTGRDALFGPEINAAAPANDWTNADTDASDDVTNFK